MDHSFLPVNHVLRTRVALFRQKSGQDAALRRHGIDRVLHHGQFARRHGAEGRMTGRGNTYRMLNLLPRQPHCVAGYDGRNKSSQCGMVPSALTNTWNRRLTQAHLELVTENDSGDQLLSAQSRAFSDRHGSRNNIGRMRGVLLPVDIIVVHHPDHQRIGERSRDDIGPLSGADDRRRAGSPDLLQHLQRDMDVLLPVSPERTAE